MPKAAQDAGEQSGGSERNPVVIEGPGGHLRLGLSFLQSRPIPCGRRCFLKIGLTGLALLQDGLTRKREMMQGGNKDTPLADPP